MEAANSLICSLVRAVNNEIILNGAFKSSFCRGKAENDKYIKQLHIASEILSKVVNVVAAGAIKVGFLLQMTLKEMDALNM